jgi:hypothetical protein
LHPGLTLLIGFATCFTLFARYTVPASPITTKAVVGSIGCGNHYFPKFAVLRIIAWMIRKRGSTRKELVTAR